MNPDPFIERGRPTWQELEALVQRAQRALTSLDGAEVDALGRLYRKATADLALAQREFPSHRVTVYLNQLVGRAHAVIYRDRPLRWSALLRFYRTDFPRVYRALLPWTIPAFLLMVVPMIALFFAAWADPEALIVVGGEEMRSMIEQVKQGELWTEIAPSVRSAAASLILTNNIQVMFLTFAGGVTAGLLTLWVLVSNGLHLGGVFGMLQAYGMARGLADFVVAHGFIELSVIFLAGGCGLYIGDGLVRPGLGSRRQVLVERARVAVRVILGCVPLLVLAGLIEGFISPSGLPFAVKLAIGLATGVGLYAYWLLAGRQEKTQLTIGN